MALKFADPDAHAHLSLAHWKEKLSAYRWDRFWSLRRRGYHRYSDGFSAMPAGLVFVTPETGTKTLRSPDVSSSQPTRRKTVWLRCVGCIVRGNGGGDWMLGPPPLQSRGVRSELISTASAHPSFLLPVPGART